MRNVADSFRANASAVFGAIMGAIIAPALGFAFDGYHSLSVYLDYEKKSVVLLVAIGAFIGFFLGHLYGTYIAKCKQDARDNNKDGK